MAMNRSLMLVVLLGNALVQAASVDPVVTTGIVSAPVNEVWKAVTTKEGIESWMEIHWPSGIVQQMKDVAADRVVEVKEPAK